MVTDIQFMERMLRHAQRVLYYSNNLSYTEFEMNIEKQDALLYNVSQIGEIATHISAEFQKDHPEFAWVPMKRLRNRVVHDYDGIKYDVIWDVVTHDIPNMIPLIEAVLNNQMIIPGV